MLCLVTDFEVVFASLWLQGLRRLPIVGPVIYFAVALQHIDSVSQDTDGKLTRVVQRKINRQDVYEAVEAMLIGSTTYVTSITRWDDMDKGDGVYGDQ